MTIELTEVGARYLLRKLEIDLEYYRTLGGNPKCSVESREKWEVVRELEMRLREVIKRGRMTW
jgi:hypothetical protein